MTRALARAAVLIGAVAGPACAGGTGDRGPGFVVPRVAPHLPAHRDGRLDGELARLGSSFDGWLDDVRASAAIAYLRRGARIVVVLVYRPGVRVDDARALGKSVSQLAFR